MSKRSVAGRGRHDVAGAGEDVHLEDGLVRQSAAEAGRLDAQPAHGAAERDRAQLRHDVGDEPAGQGRVDEVLVGAHALDVGGLRLVVDRDHAAQAGDVESGRVGRGTRAEEVGGLLGQAHGLARGMPSYDARRRPTACGMLAPSAPSPAITRPTYRVGRTRSRARRPRVEAAVAAVEPGAQPRARPRRAGRRGSARGPRCPRRPRAGRASRRAVRWCGSSRSSASAARAWSPSTYAARPMRQVGQQLGGAGHLERPLRCGRGGAGRRRRPAVARASATWAPRKVNGTPSSIGGRPASLTARRLGVGGRRDVPEQLAAPQQGRPVDQPAARQWRRRSPGSAPARPRRRRAPGGAGRRARPGGPRTRRPGRCRAASRRATRGRRRGRRTRSTRAPSGGRPGSRSDPARGLRVASRWAVSRSPRSWAAIAEEAQQHRRPRRRAPCERAAALARPRSGPSGSVPMIEQERRDA